MELGPNRALVRLRMHMGGGQNAQSALICALVPVVCAAFDEMRDPRMYRSALFATLALAGAVVAGGCYYTGGGLFSSTGGPQTYQSTELMQKTITMRDTRNGEVFFEVEVPVGKQLVINFDAGEGDDPVNTPDLLYWEIMDQDQVAGRLHNALSVPNGSSRRIDVTLNHSIKYAEGDPHFRSLRSDEMKDRPEWWTPQGGPVPKDERTNMYDN